jgi:hypothetical protein
MGIFKDIWNTIFGKQKQQEKFEKGGSIGEVPMKVVHRNKTVSGKIGGYVSGNTEPDKNKSCAYQEPVRTFCQPSNFGVCNVCSPSDTNPLIKIPNGDDFFVSNDLIEKEIKTDSKSINTKKSKRVKSIIGQNTLNEIKAYLQTYGSLDVLTCEQKFKVKSLHNFIWSMRKEGFKIKTEKVGLHNELGEKVLVTNYRLISENLNGAN